MATWGNTTFEAASNVNVLNSPSGWGTLFNPGHNGTLDSIHFYQVTAAEIFVRMAIYENTAHDIEGASLLEDLGSGYENATPGWKSRASTTNPTLTNGKYYFLLWKTDYGTWRIASDEGGAENNILSVWTGIAAGGNSHNDAYNDPCGAEGWSDMDATGSVYVTYTPVSTTPAGQIVITRYHDIAS